MSRREDQLPKADGLVDMAFELPVCVAEAIEKVAREKGVSTDEYLIECMLDYIKKEQQ